MDWRFCNKILIDLYCLVLSAGSEWDCQRDQRAKVHFWVGGAARPPLFFDILLPRPRSSVRPLCTRLRLTLGLWRLLW
jgi:hypothetical protein